MNKLYLLILIPLLTFGKLFPTDAQEFKAYSIGSGGCEMIYTIADLITDEWYIKYPVALIGGGCMGIIFSRHITGYEKWYSVGRGHWLVARIGIDIAKWRLNKKPVKAYAEQLSE